MKRKSESRPETLKQLVAYAKENPMASDTAEGIAQWCVKRPLRDVLPALETLVQLGVWERLRMNDRVLYRPARRA